MSEIVLDSQEILAVLNADPSTTRTQVLESKINQIMQPHSAKYEELELFMYHVLAQDVSGRI
jgi:hypothetical protein